MGAAERRARLRDREGPVPRDPGPELDVGRGIAHDDDLLGVIDQLLGAERGGHHDDAGHCPPRRARLPGGARGQGARPAVRDPPQAAGHQHGRHRHGQRHHKRPGEPAQHQQREPGQQPGHRQQRREHGQPAQQPAGRPVPPPAGRRHPPPGRRQMPRSRWLPSRRSSRGRLRRTGARLGAPPVQHDVSLHPGRLADNRTNSQANLAQAHRGYPAGRLVILSPV